MREGNQQPDHESGVGGNIQAILSVLSDVVFNLKIPRAPGQDWSWTPFGVRSDPVRGGTTHTSWKL